MNKELCMLRVSNKRRVYDAEFKINAGGVSLSKYGTCKFNAVSDPAME